MKSIKENQFVKDEFGAFLVKNAKFTKGEEEYPIIDEGIVSKEIPKKIITFKESLKIHDLDKCKECFVCFYEPDEDFLRVKRNPKRYAKYLSKFAGVIGLDLSVHTDQQRVKQKEQMNGNLELTFYIGHNDSKIIPNIRPGSEDLETEYFEAFPRGTLVAIGTHGFIKTKYEKCEWYLLLNRIINVLHPSGIIVYGTLNGQIFDEIKEKVPIYTYDTWAERRIKEVKQNGN